MLPNRLLLSATALFAFGLGGFIWTRSGMNLGGEELRRSTANSRATANIIRDRNSPGATSVYVRGQATSQENNRPIDDAVISVTRLDRVAPWAGVRSQRDGGFRAFTAPGRYAITAFAPGYLPRVTASITAPTSDDLSLPLSAGGVPISGSVVDEAGRPIAGAWVHAFDSAEIKSIPMRLAVSKTDARGRYRIALSPGPITLRIDRDGFEPQLHTYTVTAADALPAVALERSAVIEGVVSDDEARDTSEALTVHWSALSWSGTPDGGLVLAPSSSGEVAATPDGAFVLPSLPGGSRVGLDAYAGDRAVADTRWLRVGHGENRTEVSLTASAHPTLRGAVVDAATDAAIPRAKVILIEGLTSRRVATLSDGSFVLPRVGHAVAELRVEAHGYATHVASVPPGATSPDPRLIQLKPAEVLRTRLGSQLGGVLSIYGDSTERQAQRRRLYFGDDEGFFDLDLSGVERGTIDAVDDQGRRGSVRLEGVADDRLPPTIEMVPTVPLAGVILDDAGRPIADATVFIAPSIDETADAPAGPYADTLAALRPRATYSDATGVFRVARTVPGTYVIDARDAQGFPIPTSSQALQVREGELAAPPQQIMTSYRLRGLTGAITDERDLPAAHASITLIPARANPSTDHAFPVEPARGSGVRVRADENGRFSARVPQGAIFSIIAESQDHLQGALLGPLADEVSPEIRLQTYGHLTVEASPTRPAGSCTSVELKTPRATVALPIGEGLLEIDRVVPGEYVATFTCEDVTTSQTLTVAPGQGLRLRQAATRGE